ncbi:GvpL/GvpF family gas vesicle protein [Solirubrobacter ginsenosidimutans]|uniref:GvpL/GvpF family gas vesicle protein n=1 Tax=Solirubrobacter ginsenosidimutans TaxID=490573 RepID=A0A9X3MZL9_9ACTN|nr:GvpL/GvpF family gas vesicle protein [Solirubrobacter ginsenosidimutans]MDA0165679.1 GvpL/GvpF family gas vesicle protein [Solirubrobacter ginsenosidimutans]
MSRYVYGVIDAKDAASWPQDGGIGGPVRALVRGDIAALVSDISDDVRPGTRDDLEAQRRVLGRAIELGTVIPMRFGMVMADDTEVSERLLELHGEQLSDLLAELDGHVQMTVRAFYAEDALVSAATAGDAEIQRLHTFVNGHSELETRDQRIALGQRVAEAMDQRRERDQEALLARLRPVVSDLRVDPPGGERVALSAQVLVRRDARTALDAQIAHLGAALQGYLGLRYIGPLPPYSFTALRLEPEVSAQATESRER